MSLLCLKIFPKKWWMLSWEFPPPSVAIQWTPFLCGYFCPYIERKIPVSFVINSLFSLIIKYRHQVLFNLILHFVVSWISVRSVAAVSWKFSGYPVVTILLVVQIEFWRKKKNLFHYFRYLQKYIRRKGECLVGNFPLHHWLFSGHHSGLRSAFKTCFVVFMMEEY